MQLGDQVQARRFWIVAALRSLTSMLMDAALNGYCTSGQLFPFAYAAVGGGPTLLKAANWLTHIEYDWESPAWAPLLHWLAERQRLVRYDVRGTGPHWKGLW